MRLAYRDQYDHADEVQGGRVLRAPVVSEHTLLLESLVGADSELLSAARLVASDIFQAFGSPEVRHITADGKLRRLYFRGDTRELFRLAEDRGVEVTDEHVPGE